MRMTTNPHKLAEGQKWLKHLRKAECPSFRVYTDYIRDGVAAGYYTYGELGITESSVLELAIHHAGNDAVKNGYPHHLALLSHLQCLLQKVLGANQPPKYAALVVDNTQAEKIKLPKAA